MSENQLFGLYLSNFKQHNMMKSVKAQVLNGSRKPRESLAKAPRKLPIRTSVEKALGKLNCNPNRKRVVLKDTVKASQNTTPFAKAKTQVATALRKLLRKQTRIIPKNIGSF